MLHLVTLSDLAKLYEEIVYHEIIQAITFLGNQPWNNTGYYLSWQSTKFKEFCGILKFNLGTYNGKIIKLQYIENAWL